MVNKFILGTVQLGINYGVNNISGKPSEKESDCILETAFNAGINLLDTAESYGNAINIIGSYHSKSNHLFQVINKFGSLKESSDLKEKIEQQLHILGIKSFYAYLFHSPKDFNNLNKHPQLLNILKELKNKDIIKKIGVSVYSNSDLNLAINNSFIDIIQFPFNLLDNNNKRLKLLKLAKKEGKEIHCRSVFLQGLFYMDPHKLPANLKPLFNYISELNTIANNNNYSLPHLAMAYALCNPYIDKIIIGVESEQQLVNNIKMAKEQISSKIFEEIDRKINVVEENLLYPYNW